MDLTGHWVGAVALLIFALAYLLVIVEEFTHLRKSKPVILAAGIIWILTALAYAGHADSGTLPDNHMEQRVLHHVAEYGALFLFLMVAMTYISAIAAP